jgi:hypothetical protein
VLGVPADLSKEIYDEVLKDFPDVAKNRLPSILYLGESSLPWYLGVTVELLLIVGGVVGWCTAYIRRDPNQHPIIKDLARYGDVEKVINEIDADMKASKLSKVYLLQFTNNWLIYKAGTSMHFMRYDDLMWLYERTITRRSRYGETVNHYFYIHERDGQTFNIDAEHKDVRRMLMAVAKKAPWAATGYSTDMERAWKGDREGFVRSIDERHKQMMPFV